jgi:hypothetical protein
VIPEIGTRWPLAAFIDRSMRALTSRRSSSSPVTTAELTVPHRPPPAAAQRGLAALIAFGQQQVS